MIQMVESKIVLLRDWLWPQNWPREVRNTLTGVALAGIYMIIVIVALLLFA